MPLFDEDRKKYLLEVREEVKRDIYKLEKAILTLEKKEKTYTADEVIAIYKASEGKNSFFLFMRDIIEGTKQLGKISMSEKYTTTLNSFIRFRDRKDIALEEIDSDLMAAYEVFLKTQGLCPNTSSFYMRNLRAVYNRAVEKKLTPQQYPFKHVYTGIDKTVKRAISLEEIRQIKELDLSRNPSLAYSRDLFLFCFYTRGMSFIDVTFLKKKDLNNGFFSYRRKKTGQLLSVRWENCMQEITDRYTIEESPYLLPIIRKSGENERKQYKNASYFVNRNLKIIGKLLKLPIPLTMYVARHTWASIARSKNIPISVISEGMGHDSEITTQIYLASLDTTLIDKANDLILKSL